MFRSDSFLSTLETLGGRVPRVTGLLESLREPKKLDPFNAPFSHIFTRSRLLNACLVGGWSTPLKNMKVNWDDYFQSMGK